MRSFAMEMRLSAAYRNIFIRLVLDLSGKGAEGVSGEEDILLLLSLFLFFIIIFIYFPFFSAAATAAALSMSDDVGHSWFFSFNGC